MIMGQDKPKTNGTDTTDVQLSIVDNLGKVASDLIAGIFGKEPTEPRAPAPLPDKTMDYTPFVIVGVPLAAIAVFAALRK